MTNNWQIKPQFSLSDQFIELVQNYAPNGGIYLAQLLYQRGIRSPEEVASFLDYNLYPPASCFDFGDEILAAIERIKLARETNQIVTIWGDFDADGITSTAVLWEGLGQFFIPNKTLFFYIPNRIKESHGLNKNGIDNLREKCVNLIITCDTGSTNHDEIDYAKSQGIDVIVTDHHTLPKIRPNVSAIINPRYLPIDHKLYNLSGVAVAYKLLEALYHSLPEIPTKPLENLLDLVAIGLIADLVNLTGDCRYLVKKGINILYRKNQQRKGIELLLDHCKKNGDRPTDISFGIGPRINAVSRMYGQANFCLELLTSNDKKRCEKLARITELANTRRKALQKQIIDHVEKKLTTIDLSTTSVIVLSDAQWNAGILGLVAGQIAQKYGKPTILLSTEPQGNEEVLTTKIARGSARSIQNIDLYQLIDSQRHLLQSFGGHPLAAGLSLLVENIPIFTEAINQQLRKISLENGNKTLVKEIDLVLKVKDLGDNLWIELQYLEPCGMGNNKPKILLKNCWFEKVYNENIKDHKGKKLQYIKTTFTLCDESSEQGLKGVWWGHYKDELLEGKGHRFDVIIELDFNPKEKQTEIRLVDVKLSKENQILPDTNNQDWLEDYRGIAIQTEDHKMILKEYPKNWDEFYLWLKKAQQNRQKLAIAYPSPDEREPMEIWTELVGIAKYVSRTEKIVSMEQITDKLKLSDRTIRLGLKALFDLNFKVNGDDWEMTIIFSDQNQLLNEITPQIKHFLDAIKEEQFYQKYFYNLPLNTIEI